MSTTDTTALTTALPKPHMMVRIEQHISHLLTTPANRERFAAVLMQQIRTSPALQKCTPESVLAAIVRMAQLRLDPALPNECWLVPYTNEATFLVGYGGLRKLALRSAEVQDLLVAAVHEQDLYVSPATPIALPTHRRPEGFRPRGRVIGYYAAALLTVGHWRVIEMSKDEVKAHRERYSRAAQSTFWAEGKPDEEGLTNFDKMGLKTVLRQLCSPRHLSLSAEMHTAIAQEDVVYAQRPTLVEAPRPVPQMGQGPVRLQENINDLYGEREVPTVGRSAPTLPHDHADAPERLTDDPDAKQQPDGTTFLAQIEAAWQAQGLDDAQTAAAWTAVCVRYGVRIPGQLKMSVLPGLLEQARRGTLVPEMQAPQDDEAPVDAPSEGEDIPEEELPF